MVQKTPLLGISFFMALTAQIAGAEEVSAAASACHMRTTEAGPQVPYSDYTLEGFSIHLGCLLEKLDSGLVSIEDLKIAVKEAQAYIAREAPLPSTLLDNYIDPDGVIGSDFAHDFSQVAIAESFFAPYFVNDGGIYPNNTTIRGNVGRFGKELEDRNPVIFAGTKAFFNW